MTTPTAYVLDDDASVREAMTLLLALNGIPARPFASPENFFHEYRDDWTGCVLLDLQMPVMNGLDVQQVLNSWSSPLPVVIITAHGDVATTRAAMKAGAFDFLEKPVDNDVLLDVTRRAIAEGDSRRQSSAQKALYTARMARLTSREREVMRLVCEGRQSKEIASALGISPRTVEVYRSRLMEKLEARTVADVIRMGLEQAS